MEEPCSKVILLPSTRAIRLTTPCDVGSELGVADYGYGYDYDGVMVILGIMVILILAQTMALILILEG